MDCLPSELLVQIVCELDDNTQLTNVRQVSREWYTALNRDGKSVILSGFGSFQPLIRV